MVDSELKLKLKIMTTYMLHIITAGRRQKRLLLALSFFIFHISFSVAQTIKIGGNVYGGGNAGDLSGSTKVTVYAGEIKDVYGGAKQADVKGRTFVNLDGEHASDDIFIVNVYGGNDIAGKIGEGEGPTTVPTELENIWKTSDGDDKTKNKIDTSWKAFIRTSACKEKVHPTTESYSSLSIDANMLVVASIFGGGNGDYTYNTVTTGEGDETVTTYEVRDAGNNLLLSSPDPFPLPELSKTYLEIKGGCIAHVYGGGNNATVTEATTINIDNSSDHLEKGAIIFAEKHPEISNVTEYFKTKVDMSTFQARLDSWAFNHARVFGGNNKAPMAIMPKWNLQKGIIRDLYSGGNQGMMTSPIGLLLEIDPSGTYEDKMKLKIENVFGGCRMADVKPMANNTVVDHVSNPDGYNFPKDLAARTLVRGGDINNVYGGNDISGKVYFGNAVGIYTSVRGNVYGGGNGSYAYTDNENLKNEEEYRDFYYEVPSGMTSVQALTAHRPNAEQVSVRLKGTDANHPTIIGGSVYVGGNSATLEQDPYKLNNNSYPNYPLVELKIGSDVYAENVFLGNNGENMIKYNEADKENGIAEGVLRTMALKVTPASGDTPATLTIPESPIDKNERFNSNDFTDEDTFAEYMNGCAMIDMMPGVVFDSEAKGDPTNYEPHSSYVGSFYCGGNVGSMIHSGASTIDFNHKIIIYNKLVGGCNSAIVPETDYNALYEGGVIGDADTETGNKLELNLSGLLIQPKRWAVQRDGSYNKVLDANGQPTYLLTDGTNYNLTESASDRHRYLEWNTVDSHQYDTATKTYTEVAPVTNGDGDTPNAEGKVESSSEDLARRLYGGNIYGGCYSSGIVEGNVVINLNATIVERDKLFDVVQSDELGEEVSLYGATQTAQTVYNITQRNTGVILGQQGMDVFGSALNVFGGGKGEDTEIWGSTTINLNKGYTFQIFGGSEDGVIGKPLFGSDGKKLTTTASNYTIDTATGKYAFDGNLYDYNPAYSCYVNICGTKAGVSKAADTSEDMAECEFLYGGGFFGPICGNTISNIGKGRVFNSFGGSCNADILGHSETYVGRMVKSENKNRMGKLGIPATGTDTSTLDNNDCYEEGFPWVRDIVYGGNDLGGRIMNEKVFQSRVRTTSEASYGFDSRGKVHPNDTDNDGVPDVLKAGAYVEYLQGRADAIFGGCYGTYDYSDYKFERYLDSNGDPLHFKNKNGEDILDEQGNPIPIFYKPRLNNAFVNFRPTYTSNNNVVKSVYGAGQGQSREKERDLLQNRSYVLIDIPQIDAFKKYTNMEVFGAGAWGGVGMREADEVLPRSKPADDASDEDKAAYQAYEKKLDAHSAIIDLVRGEIGAAYGASFEEGVTRRTLVNVPRGSTIRIGSIFGGGYGMSTYLPCDAYEANVEYHSADACLIYDPARKDANNKDVGNKLYKGAIYGGNNNERRTLYGRVNIDVKVQQDSYKYGMTTGTVYGAGCGGNTWSEYTEVNLNRGANVWEVYGGGEAGKVYNAESVYNFIQKFKPSVWPGTTTTFTDDDWDNAWKIGGGIWPVTTGKAYWENTSTNLANPLVRVAEVEDRTDVNAIAVDDPVRDMVYKRYNANVLINEGAYVGYYAYGGGLGAEAVVAGSTYIALLGGEVKQDIYAAGTSGSVEDTWNAGGYGSGEGNVSQAGFTPSANVYIEGGTVRNVYGGGWRGNVGKHVKVENNVESDALISEFATNNDDRLGETHVIVGKVDGTDHVHGIPSITRNVYGAGEGGAIYGDAYVTINKGYIGYRYNSTTGKYDEELEDDGKMDDDGNFVPNTDLEKGGNVFGGGYVANSYCDRTHVTMYGGQVRGSVFGGGEIGPVGRGTVHADKPEGDPAVSHSGAKIYKGGETHVTLYGGHVMRNVFGGGRGYDNWGGEGWMTDDEKLTMDRSSKGFVFGTTDVNIRGGEIGTAESALHGFGNVFGGGDEGFVYSSIGKKVGTSVTESTVFVEGHPSDGGGYYYKEGNTSKGLSTACNVVVEPYCQVKPSNSITLNSKTFSAGEYVPVDYLAYLRNKSAASTEWNKLNTDGVTIHNAVFAGGNITPGSDLVYANTVTVYGNAAASLRDIYNRDLITVGSDDIGGIYGDGNLTLVDGFRELHINNYGTDFYSLSEQVDYGLYETMTPREQAYYQLKYLAKENHTYTYYESKMLHEVGDVAYKKGQKVTPETYASFSTTEQGNWNPGHKDYKKDEQIDDGEYGLMDLAERNNWSLAGVFSKYAGRPLNTIQRADFCGVFGSRMVLKGAEDRASKDIDYANYTINRVGELSLNQNRSLAQNESDRDLIHGNYFGVYSSVKYLGNLTSDVFFATDKDVRRADTDVADALKADGRTYYKWKADQPTGKHRNNGVSYNELALASGVYLEIKREETETAGKDVWGYVTGVVELDLINVIPGMGGGYVYAKNEHGQKTWHSEYDKVSVLDYNSSARTFRRFTYAESSLQQIETSGNFVHASKQIVDDCYPYGGIYNDGYDKSPAHYWYIKGSIYVYDQYISAYTGSATAYAERIELPLTITAAAHGKMTLREVQPNYYAYYDKNGNKLGTVEETFKANDKEYRLNDPISYWDYRLLSDADKAKFVEETYVVSDRCRVNGTEYAEGFVLTADEYTTLINNAPTKTIDDVANVKYATLVTTDSQGAERTTDVAIDYAFHQSNNMSHDTGYLLTYDVNNPMVWNDYYTLTSSSGQANAKNTDEYGKLSDADKKLYTEGPTYSPKESGLFGQQTYKVGDIINANTVSNYNKITEGGHTLPTGQATVDECYIMTSELSVVDGEGHEVQHLNAGTPVARHLKYTNATSELVEYSDEQWTAITANATKAKVCTSYMEFSASDYVYAGQLLSTDDISDLEDKVQAKFPTYSSTQVENYISEHTSDAYYCTSPGLYGGSWFESGKAYRAIDTWCSMSDADRAKFAFNYDALDLLIDPTYSGRTEANYGHPKVQYDGYKINTTDQPLHTGYTPLANKVYSPETPIDYKAEYTSDDPLTYKISDTENVTITKMTSESQWLSRTDYEQIPNEKHYYSPISVDRPGKYYVVTNRFIRGDIPYTIGQVINEVSYQAMNDQQKENFHEIEFTDADINTNASGEYQNTNYYYCREPYTIGINGKKITATSIGGSSGTDYNVGSTVPVGTIINQTNYAEVPNLQKGFLIHGLSPTEVSTLYVSRDSEIEDLQQEKIITVIYLYEYEESDDDGDNVSPVSERHVVNIHISFKSGVPEIGELNKPDIVLPGTTIGLEVPTVTEGAFRVISSGWQLFSNPSDADIHYNGTEYTNTVTPVYWYQNGYYIAYYAETSHGRAYSNSVPISVANFHELKNVMDDKLHHYYIDHKDVGYEPKIYINDYSSTEENGLDLFKSLIDLTYLDKNKVNTDENGLITTIKNSDPVVDSPLKGHALLQDNTNIGKQMKGGKYLEFFLHADQSHTGAWTPIADNDGECFSGTLHGDGHTISGLSASLFNHLCGDVYNLGVTGSFTGAGIAETGEGYVENCWINTTGSPDDSGYAVFGDPKASGDHIKQIVNCYYQEDKGYKTTASDHGLATPMPDKAFYNGEVAYDLNGFYLWKRYCDNNSVVASDARKYQYYTIGRNNQLTLQDAKYYESNAAYCSSGYVPTSAPSDYVASKYVEDRFADGDFIYVGDGHGTLPKTPNERLYTDPDTKEKSYYAIWPDDYIFFGQALSYDHMDGNNGRDKRNHQPLPSVINKADDRVVTTATGNRVYRAPAYFRSKKMGVAHFNPYAVFAQSKKGSDDPRYEAYKNMTAIDFTGYQDNNYVKGLAYRDGTNWTLTPPSLETQTAFYPPLLDDGGVKDFYNADLTRNLLAYTMTGTAAANTTDATVGTYLHDEAYVETETAPVTYLYSDTYRYHTVASRDLEQDNIRGHRVQKQLDGSFLALNDHVLIDKQDFNAPMAYSFAEGQRMWYQRIPDNYVDIAWSNDATPVRTTKGWEGISLPFKAEIVTTNDKGEITHFYNNSSKDDIGHEYWLRGFADGGTTSGNVYKANFEYPYYSSVDGDKDYSNTFLWDYYYSYNNQKYEDGNTTGEDQNTDEYQEDDANRDYYKTGHTYRNYPRLAAATPYIIGFPGERYYEFDLSGNFKATTALNTIPTKLEKQTITFASKPGATDIAVSDDATGVTEDGYTFKPSYLNNPDVETGKHAFLLNSDGNSYVEDATATTAGVYAFRPYFLKASGGGSARQQTRSIVFNSNKSELKGVEERDNPKEVGGTLNIYSKKHLIVVESALTYNVDVIITNTAGIIVNKFTIKPGEAIETRIYNAGVYIVQPSEVRFTKKLSVK